MTIDELKHDAEVFSGLEAGKWLREFDWKSVPVKITKLRHCCGMYALGTIYVNPDDADVMFSTYIHELVHVKQRIDLGTVGYLLKKTFRRTKLEEPAEEAEEDAFLWYRGAY